ncbi:MAG: hypothetical protein ACPGPS_11785 [Rubripirellula sp.]
MGKGLLARRSDLELLAWLAKSGVTEVGDIPSYPVLGVDTEGKSAEILWWFRAHLPLRLLDRPLWVVLLG